jgi:hypothetical protein
MVAKCVNSLKMGKDVYQIAQAQDSVAVFVVNWTMRSIVLMGRQRVVAILMVAVVPSLEIVSLQLIVPAAVIGLLKIVINDCKS